MTSKRPSRSSPDCRRRRQSAANGPSTVVWIGCRAIFRGKASASRGLGRASKSPYPIASSSADTGMSPTFLSICVQVQAGLSVVEPRQIKSPVETSSTATSIDR